MQVLKSLSLKRGASTGVTQFNSTLEDLLFREAGSQDKQTLSQLGDMIATRHLTAQEALRCVKPHFVQGNGWEPPHRIRALAVIDYLSFHNVIGTTCMEHLTASKWKERFKKAATESYSPPLQDAIVQLVYRWATAWRSHDWGVSMQQLLFELEAEGIIEPGSWKLDGAKPQVIAMLGPAQGPLAANAAAGSGASPRALSPPSRPTTDTTRAQNSPTLAPSSAQRSQAQNSAETLLRQAEGMSSDAVSLACASDALEEALSAVTVEEARSPDLFQRGTDLNARCSLHLARLQEALGQASLSDLAMAHLCEVADALNAQQERWLKLAGQYTQRIAAQGAAAAAAAPAAGPATQTPAPPAPAPAPVPDLLMLDDDVPPAAPAAQAAGTAAVVTAAALPAALASTGALAAAARTAAASPAPAAAATSLDPFDELAAAVGQPAALAASSAVQPAAPAAVTAVQPAAAGTAAATQAASPASAGASGGPTGPQPQPAVAETTATAAVGSPVLLAQAAVAASVGSPSQPQQPPPPQPQQPQPQPVAAQPPNPPPATPNTNNPFTQFASLPQPPEAAQQPPHPHPHMHPLAHSNSWHPGAHFSGPYAGPTGAPMPYAGPTSAPYAGPTGHMSAAYAGPTGGMGMPYAGPTGGMPMTGMPSGAYGPYAGPTGAVPHNAAMETELHALRATVQSLQGALGAVNQQHAVALTSMQQRHAGELRAAEQRAAALQERVTQLEQQLAAFQAGAAAAGKAAAASAGGAVEQPSDGKQAAENGSAPAGPWVNF